MITVDILRIIATNRSGLMQDNHTLLSFLYRISDIALIFISLHIIISVQKLEWTIYSVSAALIFVCLFSILSNIFYVYESWRVISIYKIQRSLFLCWIVVSSAFGVFLYFAGSTIDYQEVTIASWMCLTLGLLSVSRLLLKFCLSRIRALGYNSRRVGIYGVTDHGCSLGSYIQSTPTLGMRLVGFFEDRGASNGRLSEELNGPLVGNAQDLVDAAKSNHIDVVFVAIPLRAEVRIQEFLRNFSDTTAEVFFVPDSFFQNLLDLRQTSVGPHPILGVTNTPFNDFSGFFKRLEDVLISFLALMIAALPMLLIALLIKITSNGPVFFKQKRYGFQGKLIQVWKYRTMATIEDDKNVVQATKKDPRVTLVGAMIRRTSLDELPQLFNVLAGSMSIVGPRPHAIAHNEYYRKLIPGYMLRHKVKPGITGWAQINGYRGEIKEVTDMEKRVQYDLWYIKNWSLWLDLKILLMTLFVGFSHPMAY
jgi:putative colanic acid biosynthesis UDP-glucose lipid carrier transferase